MPVLAGVRTSGAVDLVTVKLVTGQSRTRSPTGPPTSPTRFGVQLCRVRDARPGLVTLEFVRSDTLADPIPALPSPGGRTWPHCRWAAAKTARRGCCGCSARMC